MRNHHSAAREAKQCVFKRFKGFNIKIVGRFVEQQQVAALLQSQSKIQTIAFTTGQHAGELLLVGTLETEGRHIRAGRHFNAGNLDEVKTVRHGLPQVFIRVKTSTILIDITDLHGLTDLQRARRQRFKTDNGLEQGGLTHAVRADHADNAVTRQREAQIVDEHAVAERLVNMLGFQHSRAQTRTSRNLNLGEVKLLIVTSLLLHLVVTFQTSLVLSLTGLRRRTHPIKFALQTLGELGVLGALDLHTLGLRLQIRGVVALIRVQLTTVDLADPLSHVIHEVTIVGNGDDGTLVLVQELLQPQNRLGIKMVGRLVKQQQIRSFQQQLAQCHTTAFATGAHRHRSIRIRALQSIHSLLKLRIKIPTVCSIDIVLQLAHLIHQSIEIGIRIGHLFANLIETSHFFSDLTERHLDVLANSLGVIQRRFLLQNADGITRSQRSLAIRHGVESGHDLQQRGLTHAVRANNANLRAWQEAQSHVIENHTVAVSLAGLDHLVNEFSQCCVPSLRNVGIPACCMSGQRKLNQGFRNATHAQYRA